MKTLGVVYGSERNLFLNESASSIASVLSWQLWAPVNTTRSVGIGANVSTNCRQPSGIHCPRMLTLKSPVCSIV